MTKRAFCTGRTDENGRIIITPAAGGHFRVTASIDYPTMQAAMRHAIALHEEGATEIQVKDKRGGRPIRPFEPLS